MEAVLNVRNPVSSAVLCSILALNTGCSTSYSPRPGPRVAIIQRAGTPAYFRDGRVYDGGMFGGDLEEAVAGNPEAEAHARAFKSGMVGGFVASLLGAVGLGVGLVTFAHGTAEGRAGESRGKTNQTIGAGVLAGGAVAYLTGLALMLNAQPHLWDAVNVYNDGLIPGPGPPHAAQPGPYSPPTRSPPPAADSPGPAPLGSAPSTAPAPAAPPIPVAPTAPVAPSEPAPTR